MIPALTIFNNLKTTWHYYVIAILLMVIISFKIYVNYLNNQIIGYKLTIAEQLALITEIDRVSAEQDKRKDEAEKAAAELRKKSQAAEATIPDSPEDCEGMRKYLIEIAKNGPYAG